MVSRFGLGRILSRHVSPSPSDNTALLYLYPAGLSGRGIAPSSSSFGAQVGSVSHPPLPTEVAGGPSKAWRHGSGREQGSHKPLPTVTDCVAGGRSQSQSAVAATPAENGPEWETPARVVVRGGHLEVASGCLRWFVDWRFGNNAMPGRTAVAETSIEDCRDRDSSPLP